LVTFTRLTSWFYPTHSLDGDAEKLRENPVRRRTACLLENFRRKTFKKIQEVRISLALILQFIKQRKQKTTTTKTKDDDEDS